MVIVICNYDLEQLQHQSTMALLSLKDTVAIKEILNLLVAVTSVTLELGQERLKIKLNCFTDYYVTLN